MKVVEHSQVKVHKFILTGGFRILPERRSGTEVSVVGSDGNASDLTMSSHSCSDWLNGTAAVDG